MNEVELAPLEAMAKEILRRCLADEDPAEIRRWIIETANRLGGGGDSNALMTWEESFDLTDQIIAEYERQAQIPVKDQKRLTFPWRSWNKLIDPLEPGMLAVVTAPDGLGKSIIAESVAEHWAKHKNKIAFVHYELSRNLMMLRRLARHTSISVGAVKMGNLNAMEKSIIAEMRPALTAWDGCINYLHTPGWTVDRTLDELRKLHAQDELDAVVLDYLEKIAPSRRQLQMFGANAFQREADNVEQIKNFAESTGVPVLMIAQMNKGGKKSEFENVDRTGIRGAGEKSDKSNLVIMMGRDRTENGYSDRVHILIDKNTMGPTGAFDMLMEPQYFRMSDLDEYQPVIGATA